MADDQGSGIRDQGSVTGADDGDFERGYHGHGRGIVVTQPEPGVFHERPMTPGELAARGPAWAIGADPYEFLNRAAFAYIKAWEVIAPAIDAAIRATRTAAFAEAAKIAGQRLSRANDCEMLTGEDPETGVTECRLEARGHSCICAERMEEAEKIRDGIRALIEIAADPGNG